MNSQQPEEMNEEEWYEQMYKEEEWCRRMYEERGEE